MAAAVAAAAMMLIGAAFLSHQALARLDQERSSSALSQRMVAGARVIADELHRLADRIEGGSEQDECASEEL